MVARTDATSGSTIRAANSLLPTPTRFIASRLVRLETGSSRLAVLASQTVVIASGMGGTRITRAIASMTGVSSTAGVSRLRNAVEAEASSTQRTNSAA